MHNDLPCCGICGRGLDEVDQLVQLGTMGQICLECLEVIAHHALPTRLLECCKTPCTRMPTGDDAGCDADRPLSVVSLAAYRATHPHPLPQT